MAVQAKEELPGGSLKYQFVYLNMGIFRRRYHKNLQDASMLPEMSPFLTSINRGSTFSTFSEIQLSQTAGLSMAFPATTLVRHLGLFLYEYLGEEYPEVLGRELRWREDLRKNDRTTEIRCV